MTQTTTTPNTETERNFLTLLKKFDRAMLVTQGDELHGRPMAIARADDDGTLWFISGVDSSKIAELEGRSELLAVMQNSSQWLTVTGRGELSRDRTRIEAVWKDSFRAWFSGKDDPNIVLIRLQPSAAEYWDSSGLKGIKLAVQVAAAKLTGKSPRAEVDDPSNHGKLRL
jgi:general stress protein 26